MFRLATVTQWWEISRNFPLLRQQAHRGSLKALGYAHVLNQILTHKPKRLLEFGHGYGSPLFHLLDAEMEFWAIDDFVEVPYWTREKFEENRQKVEPRFPRIHFVRGLMGAGRNELPAGHFDMVCSVSVLEELAAEEITKVVADAARALKVGGIFANSMDLTTRYTERVEHFFRCHCSYGFEWLDSSCDGSLEWNMHEVAFEDPCYVMQVYMGYQSDEGRQWPGNFCTVLSAARKCAFLGRLWKRLGG